MRNYTQIAVYGCSLLAASCLGNSGTIKPVSDQPNYKRTMVSSKRARPLITAPTTLREAIVEQVHGIAVADPYRWMESEADDDKAPRLVPWLDAQQKHTEAILAQSSVDPSVLKQRLTRLLAIDVMGTPLPRYDKSGVQRLFYTKRKAHQNQPVLYVQRADEQLPLVVVDPNQLASDGTAAMDWYFPSQTGLYVAYGISVSGDEMSELRIFDVVNRRVLSEKIPRTPHTTLAWLPDDSGFYYEKLPDPGAVPKGEEFYHRRVYFHRMGTEPSADREIFGRGRDMREMHEVYISPNGRFLVVVAQLGWAQSEVFFKDLRRNSGKFVPITSGKPHLYLPEVLDDQIVLFTNEAASRGKLMRVDYRKPKSQHWKPLVEETQDVLESFAVVGGKIVARYLHQATSQLKVFDLNGHALGEIALPTQGTVDELRGDASHPTMFFRFVSYLVPPKIFEIDLARWQASRDLGSAADTAIKTWGQVRSPFVVDDYQLTQAAFRSKDGTSIPLFIVHRKDLKRDGRNPTWLWGYGGFNVNITPRFIPHLDEFLRRGGVYVDVVLRGGGEFGEDWHRAGMLEKKQNVFDDFIGAAEYLIKEKYTQPAKLAIEGRSNGGLLMGAVMTQRPDLFAAVICGVPLLDMLRYHQFLIAKLWVPEYGSAEDPDQFKWLYAYSPYHRVKEKAVYPATLLLTGVSDGRVHPIHAFKMAAQLQAANAGNSPILLRAERKAGHGQGKPISKKIDELVDVYRFLVSQLGM